MSDWFKKLKWRYRQHHNKRYQAMTVSEIFSTIYRENTWGGEKGTFYSGSGTADPNTTIYVDKLVAFIKEKEIKKIVEIGCGDFSIMAKVLEAAGPSVKYIGLDVVPELIEFNKNKFGNARIDFTMANGIDDPLPAGDLVIIRQVLQHLNNESIKKVLEKVKTFRFGLITEHIPITPDVEYNVDKTIGPNIRMKMNSGVFIDKPPFSVPNASIFVEYRADDPVKKRIVPAMMRTYLYEK